MTMRPDAGIDLLYVDWLKCKRMSVTLERRREAADGTPELHLPR